MSDSEDKETPSEQSSEDEPTLTKRKLQSVETHESVADVTKKYRAVTEPGTAIDSSNHNFDETSKETASSEGTESSAQLSDQLVAEADQSGNSHGHTAESPVPTGAVAPTPTRARIYNGKLNTPLIARARALPREDTYDSLIASPVVQTWMQRVPSSFDHKKEQPAAAEHTFSTVSIAERTVDGDSQQNENAQQGFVYRVKSWFGF